MVVLGLAAGVSTDWGVTPAWRGVNPGAQNAASLITVQMWTVPTHSYMRECLVPSW